MTLAPSTELGLRLQLLDHEPKVTYELDDVCAVPGCQHPPEAGSHHIEPRSRTGRKGGVDFVAVDGMVVPNRCRLCTPHHRAVTGEIGGHKARIVWDDFQGWWAFQTKQDTVWVGSLPLRGIEGYHIHTLVMKDGRPWCEGCNRPVPEVKSTEPVARRTRITITEPAGEEGVLEDLLIQLVEKYRAVWPDELAPVGADHWKYRAVHFAAYAALTADLVPRETGG